MSLWAEYRAAKRMYETQKALAPFHGVAPTDMPSQLRVDISPAGVSMATMEANTFMFVSSHACENYGAALAKAAEEIRALRFLKSGCALILALWPPDVKHETIPVGANQKYNSVKLVDQKIMPFPEEFNLDLNYAYRAIQMNSWSEAHYIGIRMDGWNALQEATPPGVLVARYWGALATLEVLLNHFHSVFAAEDAVIGIVGIHHILYCEMAKGVLRSLKLSDRSSLKHMEDLKKMLMEFELPRNSSIYMVDLTGNSAETDSFCMMASQEENVDMNLVDKKELLQSLKMLAPAEKCNFLPVSLLQGGKDAI